MNKRNKVTFIVMEHKCEGSTFPAGIDAEPNIIYMKIAYATGGFYFHLLMMIWAKEKWSVYQLQHCITQYLIGFMKDGSGSSLVIDCDIERWKFSGYLARMNSCKIFDNAALPYIMVGITWNGYPNNI